MIGAWTLLKSETKLACYRSLLPDQVASEAQGPTAGSHARGVLGPDLSRAVGEFLGLRK